MMATSSPVIPFKSQEEPMSPVPEISRSQEEGQEPIASVEDMEKLVSILEVHSIGEDVRDSGVAFT
ncbi:hypothetical protein FRC02_002628 [Tulasnella sp. 418]|nr:hypothetical protein FRC02_002628 [Tulasnella sp. 418]